MVSRYREYGVHPALAGYVTCYWTLDVTTKAATCHPVLPDGCIDLLFKSRAATLAIVGTMTRTLWVHECGPTQLVGARFKAGGAVPFLRDRADLLTDNIAESETAFGRAGAELKERLLECGNLDERVRLLERFLMRRLTADLDAVDSRIAWATSKLLDDPGSRIEALARDLGP